ncbi:MAG: hypothetical protein GX455_17275 [Phycisphaerae bacterium]|nr:hypothetical protein [Phycisphaerae bacterium]
MNRMYGLHFLVIAAAFLAWLEALWAACPPADLNGDCRVDLADLAEFGPVWLTDNCQYPSCIADLTGDQTVSSPDLLAFAGQWLRDDNLPVRIKWLGHASLKIWINEFTIYIDPYQLVESPHDADLILITHSHSDHFSSSDINKAWKNGAILVGPSDVSNPNGQRQLIQPGQTLTFGPAIITAVPSYNIVKTNHPKSKNWLGFIVESGLVRIYAAGDTERIPEMKTLGNISVAFLPIDGTYTMNTIEAAAAAGDIDPDLAVPYHIRTANPQDFVSRTSCPSRALAVGQTIASEDWMANPSLIGHWPLDESDGTLAHDLASGNTGTVNGSAVWQPLDGRIGGACLYDGLNDYLDLPMILNPSSGPFSAFVWVRGTRPGAFILVQNDGSGAGRGWLVTDAAGKLFTRLSDTPSTQPLTADFVVTDGDWHLVGVVWDGSFRRLYADGVEVAADSVPLGKLLSSDGRMNLGAGKTPPQQFSLWVGSTDDLRIWNRALLPAEIPTP